MLKVLKITLAGGCGPRRTKGVKMATVYKNGPTKCQKHFRKSVDINQIMRKHKFNLSGLMSNPQFAPNQAPKYIDFTSQDDFQTNSIKVANIKSAFERLPANIKSQFQNNPGKYIDFMYNVSNPDETKNTRAKAVELGLVQLQDSTEEIRNRLIAEGVSKLELKEAIQAEYEKKYPKPITG